MRSIRPKLHHGFGHRDRLRLPALLAQHHHRLVQAPFGHAMQMSGCLEPYFAGFAPLLPHGGETASSRKKRKACSAGSSFTDSESCIDRRAQPKRVHLENMDREDGLATSWTDKKMARFVRRCCSALPGVPYTSGDVTRQRTGMLTARTEERLPQDFALTICIAVPIRPPRSA